MPISTVSTDNEEEDPPVENESTSASVNIIHSVYITCEEFDLTKLSKISVVRELERSLSDFRTYYTRDTPRNNNGENTNIRTISSGKIFSHELLTCSDEELLDQLQSEN